MLRAQGRLCAASILNNDNIPPQFLNSEINSEGTQLSLLNQLPEVGDPHAIGYLPGMRDPLAIDS